MYKLGYSGEVVDSCSVLGYRKHSVVSIAKGMDYRAEVVRVIDVKDSADRRLAWVCECWRTSLKEDQEKTGLAVHSCFAIKCIAQNPDLKMMRLDGRSYHAAAYVGHVSAAHMKCLSHTGCPVRTVKSWQDPESCRYSNVQAVPASEAYAVH